MNMVLVGASCYDDEEFVNLYRVHGGSTCAIRKAFFNLFTPFPADGRHKIKSVNFLFPDWPGDSGPFRGYGLLSGVSIMRFS